MAEYLRHQIAEMTGVNLDTLRYYEKKGLILPQRASNGYRVYSEEVLDRLSFIRRAKEAGFTLEEIKQTLMLFEIELNLEDLSQVMQEGIAAKITEIDLRIKRLLEIRGVLTEIHEGLKERHVCPTLTPMIKKMG